MRVTRLVSAALLGISSLSCQKTRLVDFEMTWSRPGDSSRIIFTFREFPNHYVDVDDEGLRRYVETLGTDVVPIRFAVTTRLGCLERIRTVRIGDRDDWSREWGGSGWVGSEDPSPWKRFGCKIPWWRPGSGVVLRF